MRKMPKTGLEINNFERENYKIEIDKTGLIRIEFVRNFYKEELKNQVIEETQNLIVDAIALMSNNIFDEYRVIVDYTLITNTDFFPIQSRKAFIELIGHSNIKKIAIFSESKEKTKKFLLLIFKAMNVLISSCEMKMFDNEEEAMKWIKK